jgi:energy-coupling factor transport system substrate-specific component
MSTQKKKRGLAAWTTRDILVTAAIAIVFGLLLSGVDYFSAVLVSISPVFAGILAGFYFLPGIMVMYIIRRPGAAVLMRVLVNLVMLSFTPFGWMHLVISVVFGLSNELPFLLARYRDYRLRILLISGGLAGLLSFVLMFAFAGIANLAVTMQVIGLVVFVASGALIGGALAKALADAIAKTGVLASFAIGQEQRDEV